jgi:hypothetical protein
MPLLDRWLDGVDRHFCNKRQERAVAAAQRSISSEPADGWERIQANTVEIIEADGARRNLLTTEQAAARAGVSVDVYRERLTAAEKGNGYPPEWGTLIWCDDIRPSATTSVEDIGKLVAAQLTKRKVS